MDAEQIQGYVDTGIGLAIAYSPKVVLALVVLIVGFWMIGRVTRGLQAALGRSSTDETLTTFLGSLTSVLLKALLLVSVASMIGIATTSFVAMLGAAGLAVGLALQGSLANFAGGVLILLFRPYRVGDFIDAQGVAGTVNAIQIFNTVLKTPDNKTIIVPNGAMSNGVITNVSTEETRRVDFVFGIGYEDDISKARDVIAGVLARDERIFAEPASAIVVSSLGDSSVNFTVRVWVKAADYWGVFFDTTERVKLAFDAAGVTIPFPQRDVHVHQAA